MLPGGWFADRYSRVRLLAFGLFVWTTATFAASFVQNFWQFALARIALGIGQATVNPTAYSLLSDYFGADRRAFVLSVFSGMVFVGEDIGMLMGVISQHSSWRISLLILGIPGFIVVLLLLFTVKDPKRGQADEKENGEDDGKVEGKPDEGAKQPDPKIEIEDSIDVTLLPYVDSFLGQIKILFTIKPFISLWITTALRYISGYALGGWMQVFYRRVHGLTPTEITIFMAVIVPLGGLTGSFFGGWLSDKYGKGNPVYKSWLCVVSCVGGAVFMIPMLLVKSHWLSFAMMLFSFAFAESWLGPTIAIVQELVHPKMRSIATTVFYLSAGVGSLATVIVGALNSAFNVIAPFGEGAKSYDPTPAMLVMVAGVYAVCAIGYTISAILLRYHVQDMLTKLPLLKTE